MKIPHTLRLASLLLCCTPVASIAQQSRLDSVLKQMDEASTKFKSAQADFTQDLYERVVKETTTETGSVFFERKGTSTEMGLKIQPPNTRFVDYKNGVARIFDPGANHITEIRAAQYERFLTLGFGGSGHDLAAAWTITDQGPEQLNDGSGNVTVEKLDLVSKDPAGRNNFSHITIWVDPTRSLSFKQQLFTPSGDYRTSTYTHIHYNQKVDAGPYAIKLGKNPTIDRR
ncbi:LolA family protein [Granulicella sibirica]|uniref:Outer membrane lipoprotein-sorting protein n=1 Tax=Granulicella sibirica TaxID=2479048 RepID=A0A4Q0T1X6_9BACT|nr:outer membrane lipoprotein-sorting protein [Granulicella sibirica]RXH55978.1 hypothetical protein GRAN_2835 [Granulicella sibirica]